MRRFLPVAMALAALALTGNAASAATQAQIREYFNDQRAANGLPRVSWDSGRANACRAHNNYSTRNNIFSHGESRGLPGFTPAGHETSLVAVLARGKRWSATRTPWEGAPLHLQQIFDPLLTSAGGSEDGNFNCLWFRSAAPDVSVPTAHSYPGNGAKGVPFEELAADEEPFHPSSLVGLGRRLTGPSLIVYATGLGNGPATIDGVTVIGPAGPVAVREVEAGTRRGRDEWPRDDAAIIVPEEPLRPGATYAVALTWRSASGLVLPQAFTFTTRKGTRSVNARMSYRNKRLTITVPQELVGARGTLLYIRRNPGARSFPVLRQRNVRLRATTTTIRPPSFGGRNVFAMLRLKSHVTDGVRYASPIVLTRLR